MGTVIIPKMSDLWGRYNTQVFLNRIQTLVERHALNANSLRLIVVFAVVFLMTLAPLAAVLAQ